MQCTARLRRRRCSAILGDFVALRQAGTDDMDCDISLKMAQLAANSQGLLDNNKKVLGSLGGEGAPIIEAPGCGLAAGG